MLRFENSKKSNIEKSNRNIEIEANYGIIRSKPPVFNNEDEKWQWLIQRDFGDASLNEYNHQKRKVSGIEQPKNYYKDCFELFSNKVEDFFKFIYSYKMSGNVVSDDEKLEFEAYENDINITCNLLKEWQESSSQDKLLTIGKTYLAYINLIQRIAFNQKAARYHFWPALYHSLKGGYTLTALTIINLPHFNINQYPRGFHGNTPILDAINFDQKLVVVDALLEKTELNLFSGTSIVELLEASKKKNLKTRLLYLMLKTTTYNCFEKLIPFLHSSGIRKEDVFQHIETHVKDRKDPQEKLNILYSAIENEDGKQASALSYYFNEIKSENDVVIKIQGMISVIEKDVTSKRSILIDRKMINADEIDKCLGKNQNILFKHFSQTNDRFSSMNTPYSGGKYRVTRKVPNISYILSSVVVSEIPPFNTTEEKWLWLIKRDFGTISHAAYMRQKNRVSGIEDPQKYYDYLYNRFEAKIDELFIFAFSFNESSRMQADSDGPSIRSYKNDVCGIVLELKTWHKLTSEKKKLHIRGFYELYNSVISCLASVHQLDFETMHSPFAFAMKFDFTLTALSIIEQPGLSKPDVDITCDQTCPIIDAMYYSKNNMALMALLHRTDINLFPFVSYFEDAFKSCGSKIAKAQVLYFMLKSARIECARKILPIILIAKILKEDVFQAIMLYVEDARLVSEKLNILSEAIAVKDGMCCSSLSFYLHNINSSNNVVKKIQDLINDLVSKSEDAYESAIGFPEVCIEDLNSWPDDEGRLCSFTELPKYSSNYISLLEQSEPPCSIDNLIEYSDRPKYVKYHLYDTQHFNNESPHSVRGEQMFKHEMHHKRNAIAISLVSLGVGLGVGMTLGFGFHMSILTCGLTALLSSLMPMMLMGGSYFMVDRKIQDMRVTPIVPEVKELVLMEDIMKTDLVRKIIEGPIDEDENDVVTKNQPSNKVVSL